MSRVIGIDFGTTNSLVSIILDEQALSFVDEFSDRPHASMVCYAEGQTFCGRSAKERFNGAGSLINEGIVRSPKRMLGKGAIYVNGREMSASQVVADLAQYLKDHATNWGNIDSDFGRAVVSIPVAMDGRVRRELRDAFLQAGINIVQFVHEPLAALYAHFRRPSPDAKSYRDLLGELALVFDWGGGTLDLTICELGNESVSQIANFGDNEVGGDYIDEVLMRYVLDEVISARGFDSLVAEAQGARAELLEKCELAKIRLSEKEMAVIYVPNFFVNSDGNNDLEFSLSRAKFEELASTILSRGIGAIDRILERLDIDRRRISLCLATGGVVNTPSVQDALIQLFGANRLHVSRRGDRIISEGCAWIAYDEARLKLAKPLELVEARQSYLSIFKAGDLLPTEGNALPADLIMYCVDPRDGVAKIKLARPRQIGKSAATDARDTYTNLSVRVEAGAKPFMERIEVGFRIDDDLIVNVSAYSALLKDRDMAEIVDLEFSIETKKLVGVDVIEPRGDVNENRGVVQPKDLGALTLRSNVTSRNQRLDLVPGELLYGIKPALFDLRNPNPLPQLVIDERLFYEGCAVCGLQYNHADCQCASQLPH